MTTPVPDTSISERLDDFRTQCVGYGDAALHLASYAAVPVALNADFVHLLRINFFLDSTEALPFTAESDLLHSPLCHEVADDLYQMDADVRNVLLQRLMHDDGDTRLRDIATLLWQYVEYHSPWADRLGLERAQQLTALNLLDPVKASQWLETAQASVERSASVGEEWFVAMRAELAKTMPALTGKQDALDKMLLDLRLPQSIRELIAQPLEALGWALANVSFRDLDSDVDRLCTRTTGFGLSRYLLNVPQEVWLSTERNLQVFSELVNGFRDEFVVVFSEGTPNFFLPVNQPRGSPVKFAGPNTLLEVRSMDPAQRQEWLVGLLDLPKPEPRRPRVFISYSHIDREFAVKLYRALADAGISAWMDIHDINPGDEWAAKIAESLEQVQAFVLIVSPDSSRSSTVMRELETAQKLGKRVIPVKYGPVDGSQIPFGLQTVQWLDMSEPKSFDRGAKQLIAAIEYPAVQAPNPVEEAAVVAARRQERIPIDSQSLLYRFAQENKLGYPQTAEFSVVVENVQYVGQVYNDGIVYGRTGDAFGLQWLPKPEGPRLKREPVSMAILDAAQRFRWLPVNTNSALFKYAQIKQLGYPETDEFEFTAGNDRYVGEVFERAIVFVRRGDWGSIQHIDKPADMVAPQDADTPTTTEGESAETERARLEVRLANAREAGDEGEIANALRELGTKAMVRGDYETARAQYEESLAIFRKLADQSQIARVLYELGSVAIPLQDFKTARARFQESYDICRTLGDESGIARSLEALGYTAYRQNDHKTARACYEENLRNYRSTGNQLGIANSLRSLGMVAELQQDYKKSRAHLQDSLEIYRKLGQPYDVADTLHQLGRIAETLGDDMEAARLYREELQISEQLRTHDARPIREALDRVQARLDAEQQSGDKPARRWPWSRPRRKK